MKTARQRGLTATGWVIPLAYAATILLLAMTFPRLEYHFLPDSASTPSATVPPGLSATQHLAHVGRPQGIQAIQVAGLVEWARAHDPVIEIAAAVGDTLVETTPLLRVLGARQPLDEPALRSAIEIGDERTFEQDPKYAVRLIVDTAITALSPTSNDPTTAVQALDQIEDQRLQGSTSRSFADAGEKRGASVADREGVGIRREGVNDS